MNKTWVMFCTADDGWAKDRIRRGLEEMDDDDFPYLIAQVNNEIDAVKKFREHIEMWGKEHAPFIYMCEGRKEDMTGLPFIEIKKYDNVFRQPSVL